MHLPRPIAILSLVVILLASLIGPVRAEPELATLRVMMDDNYPPYIFRDNDGNLRGILKDLWELWSVRSGVPVELIATDWGDALRRFNADEAEVIDTVFRTAAREKLYDFSAPYTRIEVPIFFSKDVSGIADMNSLRGFTVGVKAGDACIDALKEGGIASLHPYPSYEKLIDAAIGAEIKVFCVDAPPAYYFLAKSGQSANFRHSPPLYTGQFHWAVKKGNAAIQHLVESGFNTISAAERQAITEKWIGQIPLSSDGESSRDLLIALVAAIVMIALGLIGWNTILQRQVAARTRQLRGTMLELATSEHRFRTIFDGISDAIFIQDVGTGAILQTNQRALDMFEVSAEQILTLSINDLSLGQPPYDQAHALEWISRSAIAPQIFEWRAKSWATGRPFWVEVSLRRAKIDQAPERLLALVRDISDRHDAQERQDRVIDALTQSNADLERFAYVASHDLREPLLSVTRYAQLLERRYAPQLDQDAKEFISFIVNGAKQMMGLIDGLLHYSRVGTGGGEHLPCDLNDALSAAMCNLGDVLHNGGARVVPQDLPILPADRTQMVQLFQNLLGNAVKYRDPARPLVIQVGCRQEGGLWHFWVKDNGIGIDPAYHDQIFVIFKRLHTRQAIIGDGLGLALCKRIVERHGGRIWVESRPGEGAEFSFTLSA